MPSLDAGAATLETEYPEFRYRIDRLAMPLAPGGRLTLRFTTRLEERGFPNGQPFWRLVENGIFLENDQVAPLIGMARDLGLLTDPVNRRRNGLPAELHPPRLEDPGADAYSIGHHDTDFVDAEISVTADADQTPVGPGYVVSDVVKDGRPTIVTRSDAPMPHFLSIQLARYAVARSVWTARNGRKVDLAVYHHPSHTRDVARILNTGLPRDGAWGGLRP
jgi:hypothetical protein